MATITAKSGNGLLGTLGGIATLGGLIPGAPAWLTPLGMGLGMLGRGGTGNGQGSGSGNALLDMLKGLGTQLGGGSISGRDTEYQQPLFREKTDAQLAREWSPHLYEYKGGVPKWRL